jgi:hypothetical protein
MKVNLFRNLFRNNSTSNFPFSVEKLGKRRGVETNVLQRKRLLAVTYRPLGEGKKGLDGVKIWPFFLLPIGLLGEVTVLSVT